MSQANTSQVAYDDEEGGQGVNTTLIIIVVVALLLVSGGVVLIALCACKKKEAEVEDAGMGDYSSEKTEEVDLCGEKSNMTNYGKAVVTFMMADSPDGFNGEKEICGDKEKDADATKEPTDGMTEQVEAMVEKFFIKKHSNTEKSEDDADQKEDKSEENAEDKAGFLELKTDEKKEGDDAAETDASAETEEAKSDNDLFNQMKTNVLEPIANDDNLNNAVERIKALAEVGETYKYEPAAKDDGEDNSDDEDEDAK